MAEAAGVRAWFSRLLNRASGPERAEGQVSRLIHHGRTQAGVWVDADSALKNATVWACVQYLSRTVAQLPWRVGRENAGGGFQIADSHPADYLLHKRPNPEMGAFNWRQQLMSWALREGRGYAEIEWDQRGAVYAMWPIHPRRMERKRHPDTGALFFRCWNPDGTFVDLDPADVFEVKGFGDGVGVVEYAAQSIGWAQATEVFGATFFGEGMNPSGIIKSAKPMNKQAADVLRTEAESLYKGPRGRRTMVFDDGLSFEKISYTPEDGQFIETRQHQVEEICRWFGVPPHKVMHLLRATFSNIEHQSIEVVVDSILPWVKVFEEEADYKLFPRRAGLCSKMNLKGLLRGDATARAAYYKARWETGSLSANDIKRAEDEDPMGPEGDTYFVPMNFQPIQRALEAPVPAATPDNQVTPPPTRAAGRLTAV